MQHRVVSEKRGAFGGRRALSLLLALMLIFTLGGVQALADEAGGDAGNGESQTATASPEPSPAAVPARPENLYVYDGANVLSDETESAIVEKCKALDESCGAQIAVMTMDLMPGGDAEGRKAYAAQVVEDWNLGGEGGNGLLLVLSISDEDYWVAPTDNFQSGFTLSVLKSLMSENLETDFTNKAYDAAVTNFVTAASEKAEGFVRAQQLAAGASASPEADASGTESKVEGEKGGNVFLSILKGAGIVLLVVLGLGVLLVVVAYFHGRSVRRKRMEARRRRGQRGGSPRPSGSASQRRSRGTPSARPRSSSRVDDDYNDFMNRYK